MATNEIIIYLFLAVMFVAMPLLFLGIAFAEIRRGQVYPRFGGAYRRDTQPILFWITIVLRFAMALVLGGFGVLVAITLWGHG